MLHCIRKQYFPWILIWIVSPLIVICEYDDDDGGSDDSGNDDGGSDNDGNDDGENADETANDDKSDISDSLSKTPINNGEWTDMRGDSTWIPNNEDVKEILSKYGKEGIEYENAMPKLDEFAAADFQLSEDEYMMSDIKQFDICNDALKSHFEDKASEFGVEEFDDPLKNEEYCNYMKETFKCNDEEMQDIQEALDAGKKPSDYTWHHDSEAGRMLLVPTDIHESARYKGGRSIWGGGYENR